ncbi:hypothetical protein XENTR_v10016362 [Xenopus tropicalis]|nr:hypothetical protein XENTR_v10016362 [Xenopus tropicalis]
MVHSYCSPSPALPFTLQCLTHQQQLQLEGSSLQHVGPFSPICSVLSAASCSPAMSDELIQQVQARLAAEGAEWLHQLLGAAGPQVQGAQAASGVSRRPPRRSRPPV